MRGGPKTLMVAIAALLIAVGLTACGGGDSSSSTTTEAGQGQAESGSSRGASKQSDAQRGDEGESGSGSGEGQSDKSSSSASKFTPKQHSDSGGGSQQFKVKGGDNSVQEFGEEADTSEFDEAAAAAHNFLDARAEGDWGAACDYMAKSILESFEKLAVRAEQLNDRSCAGLLEALTNPAAKGALKTEAAQADVRSLRIEGEQAFVIYTANGGTVYAMPMANESGGWKVASLAGTPLS